MKISRIFSATAGVIALAAASTSFAGKANPAVISSGSGNAGSSSLSTAVYSFAATPSIAASIASAPGATVSSGAGGQVITLPFTEGGVSYVLVLGPDGTVTVYKQ